MSTPADSTVLTAFRVEDAEEIVRWPAHLAEARAWAGAMLQRLPEAAQLLEWHTEGVRPWVLRRDACALAYGELWLDEQQQEVELARMIVQPALRHNGLGRRLVTLMLLSARCAGFRQAFVRVTPANRPAIQCYQAAGFAEVAAEEACQFNEGQPVRYVWLRQSLA